MAKDGVKIGSAYIDVGLKTDKISSDKSKIESEVKKAVKNIEDSSAKIKPTLSGDDAKKGAQQIKDDLNKSLKGVKLDETGINRSIESVKSGLNGLITTWSGLKALSFSFTAMKASADFDNLRAASKATKEELEDMRIATARATSDSDLLKLSNQADELGISLKKQPLFFSIAENAADDFGGTTIDNFQKIVAASEGSTKAVKGLGIETKEYKQVVSSLASQYGATIDKLDAETQKEIRLEAILKITGITMDDVRKKQMDNADSLESLDVAVKNTEIEFGRLLNNALRPVLNEMKNDTSFRTFVGGLQYIGNTIEGLMPTILQLLQLRKLSELTTVAAAVESVGVATATATPAVTGFFASFKAGLASIATVSSVILGVVGAIALLTQAEEDNEKARVKNLSEPMQHNSKAENEFNSQLSAENKRAFANKKIQGDVNSTLSGSSGSHLSEEEQKARAEKAKQEREKAETEKQTALDNYDVKDEYYFSRQMDRIKKKAEAYAKYFGETDANNPNSKSNKYASQQYAVLAGGIKGKAKGYDKGLNGDYGTGYTPIGAYDAPTELSNTQLFKKETEETKEATLSAENFAQTISSGLTSGIMSGERLDKVFSQLAIQLVAMTAQALLFKGIMALLDIGTGGIASAIGAHNGGSFIGTGSGVMRMAGGGSFTVPSGFPNDSFPLMVESGEHVSVTPAGQSGNDSKLLTRLISRVETLNTNVILNGARAQGNNDLNVIGEIKNDSIMLANKKASLQYGRSR
jgi:hypothetical protein